MLYLFKQKSFFFRSYMNGSDRSYMNDVQHSTIWHTYVLGKDKNIDIDLTISSRIYEELKKRLGIHHWFIYYPFTSHGYKYHFQIIIKNKSRNRSFRVVFLFDFFIAPTCLPLNLYYKSVVATKIQIILFNTHTYVYIIQ